MAIPSGWALQKPQQTIEPAIFDRLLGAGHVITERKYNGFRTHLVTGPAGARLFSRNGTLDLTDKAPHLVRAFAGKPAGLIVDAELYVPEADNPEALQDALNNGAETTRLAAFDLLDLGRTIDVRPYGTRFDMILDAIDGVAPALCHRAEVVEAGSYAAYEAMIEANGWEGVVGWDRRAAHKLNTGGNTKRGESWKIKIRQTEDLVALRVNPCGDPKLGCGSLDVARRMPDGSLKPLGKVGSFEKSFDRVSALTAAVPFAIEISHYGEDERGNLQFAKVVRARPDLHPDLGLAA